MCLCLLVVLKSRCTFDAFFNDTAATCRCFGHDQNHEELSVSWCSYLPVGTDVLVVTWTANGSLFFFFFAMKPFLLPV